MDDAPLRVLLVEDDPDDALLLCEMLDEVESVRFELTHVDRVAHGLERLREQRFDVVLLDLSLPDSHGFETFERIHAQAPEVPIVVLSGLDDQTLAVRAVQEGAQDYLVKGRVSGDLLVRAMRYAIERQQTTRYRALLRERQRFDAAVGQMSDGIVVTDGDWAITTANHAACLLLNMPGGTWKGSSLADMLERFDGSDEYVAKLEKYGVNRADEGFWSSYDWFQARMTESDPVRAGLYDLNRYYSEARAAEK